jgi:hypothetical protein
MRRAAIRAHGGAKAALPQWWPALAGLATSLFLRFELPDQRSELRGNGRREGVVLILEALPNGQQPNASIASGIVFALPLRGMGSVTVLNYMLTDPIVDAVSCLSREGNCRHGAPPLHCRAARETSRCPTNARTGLLKRGR